MWLPRGPLALPPSPTPSQLGAERVYRLPLFRTAFPRRLPKGSELLFFATARDISETEVSDNGKDASSKYRKVFVAGATGNTGKRIVKQLIAQGFKVRAGVRDLGSAKTVFPSDKDIEFVQADVTESADKLGTAIGDVDAVVCATGFRPSFDLLAPWKVDNFGTVHLIDACKKIGVKKFVLVSSILVNGAAIGQLFNPAYIVLNIFGLTLVAKLQAEQYIRQSGINYTIVRPGGLKNDPPSGNIVMSAEDTLYEGSISRDSVAYIVVEALTYPEASYKVVEIVSRLNAPEKSSHELFAAIK